ncbi:3-oxoacyl-ACP synthase III family protein [Stackebrandtia soli]|uniref:3-oxoacyl-ACP synthase III family protein n=1 Tax=Stackebrandtia soli TaxID=1892856 RepID=UPI0039EB02B0
MSAWGIVGTGHHLPDRVVDNEEVARDLGIPAEWIVRSTGIHTRRRAAPHEASSDLAAAAARASLLDSGRDVADVGLIVVGTSTPDELGPSTACRVQASLGAAGAAVDIGAACAGYLFGLQFACGWLSANPDAGCAVVIGTEVYSRFLDPRDRTTAVLFGDGAGATVIDRAPDGHGIRSIRLGSDGTGADHVLIPAGGSRRPADASTIADDAHRIRMDASAVRDDIRTVLPRLIADALTEHAVGLDDLDLLIPHQPNPRTLRIVADHTGMPLDRIVIVGEDIGNIGAASIPTALDIAARGGRVRAGDTALLIAIGAGMTWGRVWLRWHDTKDTTP